MLTTANSSVEATERVTPAVALLLSTKSKVVKLL